MKQIVRYIIVVMMLFVSMTASAQSTIKVMTMTNGTVTADKSSASKNETVTLTVTPIEGYYFQKENLEVVKTINPNFYRTRGEIPMSGSLSVSGEDPADLSTSRKYTFVVPDDGYEIQVSATFTARTSITDEMVTLSETSFTYNGSDQKPTISVTGLTEGTDYSISFAESAWKEVGTYSVSVSGISKYKGTFTKSFTISAADGSLTPPIGKSDLVYTGAAQDLITAGSSTTGTIQYSLDGTSYSTSIPQGTDAKEYTVYYKVAAKAGYNDIPPASFAVTIESKTVSSPTITLSETRYTYDGSAKEPMVTVMDGGTIIPTSEYTVTYTDNTNVGTATVTITDKDDGNYTVSGSTTFSISSADGSLIPPSGKTELVYKGSAQDLITAGSSTTGTMEYSLDGTTYDTAIPQGTDAKEYTVYYKVVANPGYKDVAPASFKVTIAPKTISSPIITLSQTGYTYDGTAKEPTVTVKDGETTIPASEYTVTYTNNTNVGTATVTITDKDGGNYTVSGSTTFSIASADGSLVPPSGKTGLVYTGSVQDLITAGSSTTGSMEYSLDGTTYNTAIPQGTDAKDYTVYYKVVAKADYNDIPPTSFKVTIAAKTVSSPTIILSESSYTYDGNAKEPVVTVMDGETIIPSSEYTVSYQDNTEVGTATVTITDKEGGNYAVSGTTTFSIVAPDEHTIPVVNKEEAVSVDDQTFYEMTEEAKEVTKETIQTVITLSSDAAAVASVSDDGKMSFTQDTQDADIAILDAKKGEVLTVTFDGQMVGKKSQLKKLDSPAATRGAGEDEIELVSGVEYEILEDGDIVLTLKLEEAPVEIESITLVTPEPETEPAETYEITIGKNGKTTFCGAIGLDFNGRDDVKAFIATGFDKESSTIWMTRVKDVPAGVPVMIKGTANETYKIPVTEGGSSYYENMFVGNTKNESIKIGETSEDGKYVNYYMSGGQFKSVKTSANIASGKCYLQLPASFEAEATGEALQVKIAASGKSSFAAPYDLDFTSLNDDLKAFTATGYDKSSKTIWLTRVKKVQKGEGLLLKGTGGETYTIPSSGVQAAYENMIVGNIGEEITIYETSEDGDWTNYYLKGGTYMSVSGTANIGKNKSYLQLPTEMLAGARGEDASDGLGMPGAFAVEELETEAMPIVFGSIGGDGETTGVVSMDNGQWIMDKDSDEWYSISGQRISKPTKKGLYIHNGKKVVIRSTTK